MTLAADEFIRRFLIHVLPAAFTAFATTACSLAAPAQNIARAREFLASAISRQQYKRPDDADQPEPESSPIHARAAAAA